MHRSDLQKGLESSYKIVIPWLYQVAAAPLGKSLLEMSNVTCSQRVRGLYFILSTT